MQRLILGYGIIAGLIVGIPLFIMAGTMVDGPAEHGVLIGYTIMLIAFSTIFLAIKRRRDVDLGGVIRFLPALALGLGITAIAGIFYVVAWEAGLAIAGSSPTEFLAKYIDAQAAHGGSAEDLAAMRAMVASYANPFWRTLFTLGEIVPVGVIVSLVCATLFRFPRFLPARAS